MQPLRADACRGSGNVRKSYRGPGRRRAKEEHGWILVSRSLNPKRKAVIDDFVFEKKATPFRSIFQYCLRKAKGVIWWFPTD